MTKPDPNVAGTRAPQTFSGRYILVVGDPVKGFSFIGPFHSYEEAQNYRQYKDGGDWWIAPLEAS